MKLSELIMYLQKLSNTYKDLEVWKGKIKPLEESDVIKENHHFEIASEYSDTILYGVELVDCLGAPSLKYLAANKEIALEGVKLLQKNYKHYTGGPIFLIEFDKKELMSTGNLYFEPQKYGKIVGVYNIEHSPAITDKQYQEVQNELAAIKKSNKISLEYEGTYGHSVLLRLNFGGLVNRNKLLKRIHDFIKRFNNNSR